MWKSATGWSKPSSASSLRSITSCPSTSIPSSMPSGRACSRQAKRFDRFWDTPQAPYPYPWEVWAVKGYR